MKTVCQQTISENDMLVSPDTYCCSTTAGMFSCNDVMV